jgi:transcriptional regulator with XRE-family HTH domain
VGTRRSEAGRETGIALDARRHGLTQAKLAGVSQPAIAQLESPDSNPTIDTLNRVTGAMGPRGARAYGPRHGRAPP